MGNDVFANGREISCKAADGKAICAFPDVCMTPPENPATPPGVPIPYPNTGMASDTTSGSKKVKITNKEVMLKNKSHFKKSIGDEAGCAAKKGVVTSTNRGKVYFNAWSMDVKFEGENVVRHLDLTTHNHMSIPANTPTWPYVDSQAVKNPSHPCHNDYKKERAACSNLDQSSKRTKKEREDEIHGKMCDGSPQAQKCQKARKCMLQAYDRNTCCTTKFGGDEEAHHIVEAHGFSERRGVALSSFPKYKLEKAPTVCGRGSRHTKEHGGFHALVAHAEARAVRRARKKSRRTDRAWRYKDARKAGIKAHGKLFKDSECDPKCLKHQVDRYHKNVVGARDNSRLRTYDPRSTPGHLEDWQQKPSNEVIASMRRQLGSPASSPGG
jgi:hypothetical protein